MHNYRFDAYICIYLAIFVHLNLQKYTILLFRIKLDIFSSNDTLTNYLTHITD
jgi:hypothetical protein